MPLALRAPIAAMALTASIALASSVASAQDAPPAAPAAAEVERFERQLEVLRRERAGVGDAPGERVGPAVPVGRRLLADYGGYFTPAYFGIDDVDGTHRVLRQYDLVGYARFELDGAQELFVRGRQTWQDFHRGDGFDPEEGDDDEETVLERLYYRIDASRFRAAYLGADVDPAQDYLNVVFQGGRQLLYWGNGLTISQTLDAGLLGVSYGPFDAQLVAGVTAPFEADFDTSRPDFDDRTRRGFYGAMLTYRGLFGGRHVPYAYYLAQRDYNEGGEVRLNGPVTTRFDYDSYYVGAGINGSLTDRLVYGVEAVFEGGRGLSNSFAVIDGILSPIDQTREDIRAAALDVRMDYLFPGDHQPRLSGELILATGDDDRGNTSNTFSGNTPGTDDRAFNAFGLLNTGLAFAPSVSNLAAARVGVSALPFPDTTTLNLRRLQVGVDVFVYNKFEDDAPIDEPTREGHYLGWEPDLFLNWQLASDVTLAMRYGVFFPDADVVIAGEDDDHRMFFYTGLTFAF